MTLPKSLEQKMNELTVANAQKLLAAGLEHSVINLSIHGTQTGFQACAAEVLPQIDAKDAEIARLKEAFKSYVEADKILESAALNELVSVCKRRMASDDVCDMPFNEDMANALAQAEALKVPND